MKRITAILAFLLLGSFLVVGNAFAFPIEFDGHVDVPDATFVDNGDGTTTVSNLEYEFNISYVDSDAGVNFFSIQFESDVFASVGTISGIDPADWSVVASPSPSGNLYEIASAGTVLGSGDTFSFVVDSLIIQNDALTSPTLWDEGQIWAQKVSAQDTKGNSGPNSTVPVPEPATMLLFGLGVFGLGAVARKKIMN
jgi:hypothetical protein